jgi:hypothetical protein
MGAQPLRLSVERGSKLLICWQRAQSELSSFSRSRRFPYRMANPNPKTMIATGGASITKIARLSARCPSFGVAFAFAVHMAHP